MGGIGKKVIGGRARRQWGVFARRTTSSWHDSQHSQGCRQIDKDDGGRKAQEGRLRNGGSARPPEWGTLGSGKAARREGLLCAVWIRAAQGRLKGTSDEYLQAAHGPFWLIYYNTWVDGLTDRTEWAEERMKRDGTEWDGLEECRGQMKGGGEGEREGGWKVNVKVDER
eukprot:366535-Chlamydomonas_euryale.AAC.3